MHCRDLGEDRVREILSPDAFRERYVNARKLSRTAESVLVERLAPHAAVTTTSRERFTKLTSKLEKMAHPSIARPVTVGRDAEGPYAVFELPKGLWLPDLLERSVRTDRPLPPEAVQHACRSLLEVGLLFETADLPTCAAPQPSRMHVTELGAVRLVGVPSLEAYAGSPRESVFEMAIWILHIASAGTEQHDRLLDEARGGQPDFLSRAREDLPPGIDSFLIHALSNRAAERHPDVQSMAGRFAALLDEKGGHGMGSLGAVICRYQAPSTAPPPPEIVEAVDIPPAMHVPIIRDHSIIPPPRDTGEVLGPEAVVLTHLLSFPGRVKGALLRTAVDRFAVEYPDKMDALRSQLSAQFREELEEGFSPNAWYSEQLCAAFYRARRRVLESTPKQEIEEARDAFIKMAQLYHRAFLSVSGPKRLMHLLPTLWKLFHDVGTFKVTEELSDGAVVALDGNPALLEPGYAEATVGSIWGALSLSGARDAAMSYGRVPPSKLEIRIKWLVGVASIAPRSGDS